MSVLSTVLFSGSAGGQPQVCSCRWRFSCVRLGDSSGAHTWGGPDSGFGKRRASWVGLALPSLKKPLWTLPGALDPIRSLPQLK